MLHLQLQQSTGNQNMLQHQQNQQQIPSNLQLQHHQQQVSSYFELNSRGFRFLVKVFSC